MITALLCVVAVSVQAAPQQVTVLDETGRPIPNARVFGVDEVPMPVWGQSWFQTAASTGADGVAQLASADYSWLMVTAEGYGGRGWMKGGKAESEVTLAPEVPITLEVVDFMGRPLPLAHVGVAFGCGHTPDIVTATTDRNGLAPLRGVVDYDGHIEDVYVVHPKTSMLDYGAVPFSDAVDGVARFYCEPGSLLEGRILLPDGQPAVGYGVGNDESHRGHWAITDERGEFRLFGSEPRPDFVRVLTPGGDWVAGFTGSRVGVYRTLQLNGTDTPEAFEGGPGRVEHPTRDIVFQVNAAMPTEVPEGVVMPNRLRWIPVEIWDPVTGSCYRSETDENGRATLRLPVGEYRMEVGGPECPYRTRDLGSLAVTTEGQGEAIFKAVELPAPRLCMVDVVGLREGEQVNVQTAGGYYFNDTWLDVAGADSFPALLLVPSGLWSAHVMRKVDRKHHHRIQLDVPQDLGSTLTLRVPQ